MRKLLLWSLLAATLFMFCAGTQQAANTGTSSTAAIEEKREMDESFDPMTLGDFAMEIHESDGKSIQVVTADDLLKGAPAPAIADSSDEIDGFRVQLYSTRDEEEARSILRNAVISFSEQVYREFHNPYYKIRVGDFKSRFEATQLQEKAIQMGFSEAWVVRSMVKRKMVDSSAVGESSHKP
jgi:hypothetical protein